MLADKGTSEPLFLQNLWMETCQKLVLIILLDDERDGNHMNPLVFRQQMFCGEHSGRKERHIGRLDRRMML
jgi:hypothetical protein